MPREGYTSVTVSNRIYNRIKDFIESENEREGYRKWRSISQFIETAIIEYFRKVEKEAQNKPL